MSAYDMIIKRRSVRKFIDKEIDDDLINKLLESAMAAPSACNKRPWEFYVIKNKELQEELKLMSKYSNMNSSLIIIVAGNTKNSLSAKDNDFWIQDCSAAVENILVTAEECGLGSCWCGLYPMKISANKTREVLSLDEEIIPMALIHLGYPGESKEPRTQFEPEKVHWYN